MPHYETRHSLIIRLKDRQNESAWEAFVVAYEPFLYRMAERQGVPQRHVPDTVQQVLLSVAKSVDNWKDDGRPGSFRRWLSTVSRHIVIKFMTRERRQADPAGGTHVIEVLNALPAEPDQQQLASYEHELIVWAAEQVKDEFIATSWAAFWATVIEGRPVAEVADELKISAGSIYMSRSRIMAKIQLKVEEVMES